MRAENGSSFFDLYVRIYGSCQGHSSRFYTEFTRVIDAKDNSCFHHVTPTHCTVSQKNDTDVIFLRHSVELNLCFKVPGPIWKPSFYHSWYPHYLVSFLHSLTALRLCVSWCNYILWCCALTQCASLCVLELVQSWRVNVSVAVATARIEVFKDCCNKFVCWKCIVLTQCLYQITTCNRVDRCENSRI